jgi:hypothetical protein
MSLIDGGNSLTKIVNGLAALYNDVETLDDFKHQVDNFSRAKNETITKAKLKNYLLFTPKDLGSTEKRIWENPSSNKLSTKKPEFSSTWKRRKWSGQVLALP